MIAIFLVLVVSVCIGLAANFWFNHKRKSADVDKVEGVSVRDVLGATSLLAALLIAIVLSGAGTSYSTARTAAVQEANALDNLYESAEYVAMPARKSIHTAAVCYARSVMGPEWAAMAKGETSTVPNSWTGTGPYGLRRTLIEMTPAAEGFGMVVAADQKRGDLRSERLIQAKPTVPAILSWLMLFLVGLSLGALAYSIPPLKNTAQIIALGVVTLLFSFVLVLIHNFDRPFSGVLALSSDAMQKTQQDISTDYADAYGTELPCDAQGRPR